MNRSISRILNTGLGAEKTVGDDIYDYYMEGRDINHGIVDHKTIKDFSKKRFSMFDELLKTVDKVPAVHKMVQGYLKASKIFNFDKKVCYDIQHLTSLEDTSAEEMLADFYNVPLTEDLLGTPFPNTCVVTPDSATMLNEVKHAICKPDQHAYMYTTLTRMHGNVDMEWFCMGLILCNKGITKVQDLRVATKYFYIRSHNGKFKPYVPTGVHEYDSGLIAPVLGKVMGLVMELNTPDRFILEVTPTKTDIRSPKYVPRSHQRSEYILLHPHVIRHYMKTESDVEGHKKRGHERRAHLRRYPDDKVRFPNAHGKTIQIPALWIGRTEATVGERHYKVIL